MEKNAVRLPKEDWNIKRRLGDKTLKTTLHQIICVRVHMRSWRLHILWLFARSMFFLFRNCWRQCKRHTKDHLQKKENWNLAEEWWKSLVNKYRPNLICAYSDSSLKNKVYKSQGSYELKPGPGAMQPLVAFVSWFTVDRIKIFSRVCWTGQKFER